MKNYAKSVNISIDVIKEKVSIASKIGVNEMELPNRWPGARKRERVNARNVSMALAKDFTSLSLTTIGFHHGGRDHATVLYAHKTIGNLLETKDDIVTEIYNKSQNLIEEWMDNKNPFMKSKLSKKDKTKLVKIWIKNRVPLYIREEILESIGKRCPTCKTVINKINYGNRIKTLPNSLQRSYKK